MHQPVVGDEAFVEAISSDRGASDYSSRGRIAATYVEWFPTRDWSKARPIRLGGTGGRRTLTAALAVALQRF